MCFYEASRGKTQHGAALIFTYLLSPVIEEAGLIGLDYDNIKQVPPVFPYDVAHTSIPVGDMTGDFWYSFTLIHI